MKEGIVIVLRRLTLAVAVISGVSGIVLLAVSRDNAVAFIVQTLMVCPFMLWTYKRMLPKS